MSFETQMIYQMFLKGYKPEHYRSNLSADYYWRWVVGISRLNCYDFERRFFDRWTNGSVR